MYIATDRENWKEIENMLPYETSEDEGSTSELAIARGLNVDTDDNNNLITNSEGTEIHKRVYSTKFNNSIISKISALTLEPLMSKDGNGFGNVPYDENDFKNIDYFAKYNTFSALCDVKHQNNSLAKRRDLEYYPEDFLYCSNLGYPINRLITLRRFPYPCIDNIMDPNIQLEQDMTRMVTYFDSETNPLSEILSFSYGLNWKELEAEYEEMQMQGGENFGLSGFIKTAATFFGDKQLIKNKLSDGYNGQVSPTADSNKIHGPADSITKTYIRDVGLNFEKEFQIKFTYSAKSYAGRNQTAVLKDILSNILLCTFNDGEFWGGARYWMGDRPSNTTKMFQWMNSDNIDSILSGGFDTLKDIVQKKFNSKGSALETLKDIVKGGFQMAMANILNTLGRPGVPTCSSLLSNSPVGMWHLTIGHPLNPIMTIGNLICTNVEVNFPDNKLGFDDFITKIEAIVTLKPAMPRDRAGIEMMFNYGRKRLYMPMVVKAKKPGGQNALITNKRSVLSFIDNSMDGLIDMSSHAIAKSSESIQESWTGYLKNNPALKTKVDSLSASVSEAFKYVKAAGNDTQVWVTNTTATSTRKDQVLVNGVSRNNSSDISNNPNVKPKKFTFDRLTKIEELEGRNIFNNLYNG